MEEDGIVVSQETDVGQLVEHALSPTHRKSLIITIGKKVICVMQRHRNGRSETDFSMPMAMCWLLQEPLGTLIPKLFGSPGPTH